MTTPSSAPDANRQARHSIIVAVIVAVVALAAVAAVVVVPRLTGGGYSDTAAQPPNANASASGIVANPDAPTGHVLAIYQDYQCPVCAKVHQAMGDVIAKAVSSNSIRVEYRTMTFLDRVNADAASETAKSSTRAANAAACADAVGHFFAYNEYLFNNQPSEGDGFTEKFLREEAAGAAGITGSGLTDFQTCYDKRQFNSFVNGVYQAASKSGITGTPTYTLDGVKLSLTSPDALQSDIDAARAGHGPSPSPTPTATATQCVPRDLPSPNPGPLPPNSNANGTGIVANPSAPDTHVLSIYTDFQCPYCGRAEQTVGPVVAQAVAENKLRVEFHTMTFLDQANKAGDTADSSSRAANAAACADLGGFYFKYQEYVMLHQPATEGDGYTDDFLVNQIPAALGVGGEPLTAFQQCYANRQFSAFVDYVAQAPFSACVTGTPTYLLDGQQVSTSSADDLKKAIDAAVG